MADFTTLTAVKQYLAIPSSGVDALISRLISRESRLIEAWTGRTFPFVANTNRRLNGTGTGMLMLPDQPVIAVQSLQVCGANLPLSIDGRSYGYTFDDTTLYLTGCERFPMGRQNVVCSWSAGYQADASAVIPAANVPLLVDTPGSISQINSMVGADGTVFTATANAPAAGQYQFTPPNLLFSAADAGKLITIDMYYIPAIVEQACIEMVGLDVKQRDNLGIKSKTLANETISYDSGGLTQSVKDMLQPFRRMALL